MTDDKPAYFGKDLEAMSFADNYHRWIAETFEPFLGAEVAEIGAGTGNFSEVLLKTDVRHLCAFEPSANMYPMLKKKFAADDRVDTYNEFFEQASTRFASAFDAIVYVNVLEHIADDHLTLTHAYGALKDGGRLLLFVPALKFLYSELDRKVGHFRRYTRDELVDVVESAGFTVDRADYFDIAGIIPWYLAFVLMKKTTNEANVTLYDRWVVPLMRHVEGIVKPPIGKNLLLVAHKP